MLCGIVMIFYWNKYRQLCYDNRVLHSSMALYKEHSENQQRTFYSVFYDKAKRPLKSICSVY